MSIQRRRRGVVALAAGLFTAGCGIDDTPQSFLAADGVVAHSQAELFIQSVGLMSAVFVIVIATLAYVLWRFRARPGDKLPVQNPGDYRLEVVWTILPVLLLIYLAVPTMQKIFYLDAPPRDSDPLQVAVVGNQFWWRFEYPDLGIVTANELHIPVDRVVNLTMTSNDVIHSFWVPRLAGKIDVNPGKTTTLWLQADKPGVFYGQCAEFCGTSHANMRVLVVADPEDEFQAWVEKMQAAAAAPSSIVDLTSDAGFDGLDASDFPGDLSERPRPPADETELIRVGRQVFAQSACAGCHALADAGTTGQFGPNLNNYGLRQTLASGILPNTAENLANWIRNPQKIKPGAPMPEVPLDESELEAVVAYLLSLK